MFLVYGKPECKFCTAAKDLLTKKGSEFKYLTLGEDYTKEGLMDICKPYIPKTLPQIFFEADGRIERIGGFTELKNTIQ